MEIVAPQCLTFRPRDDELIDLFLGRKIAGQPPLAAACFIHERDVYSAAPDQLVTGLTAAPGTGFGDARVWYFFSPVRHCAGKRKARTVGGADGGKMWWHSETGQKTVEGSATAGCFQKFSFKVKTASGVVKPGWLMVEYSIGGADLVLCKVYRSPRAAPPQSRVVSSSTTTAALSESFGCKKRKAEEEHPEAPPPCSARRQMTDEEDDDMLAFAESLQRGLTSSEYHPAPGGELAYDHHRTEEAPPPCGDWQHPVEEAPEPCRAQLQMIEEMIDGDGAAIPLQHFEHDQMWVDDDMSALLPLDFNELDLFGGEPGDYHPGEGAPPPCSDQQQTMDEEEDDDVVLFAESLKSTLTVEYHHGLGGELDDHHPTEEAPQPCSDWQQMMDKEEDDDVVLFAESLKSTLTPDYYHGPGGDVDDHHPAGEARQPCSANRQMTDKLVLEMEEMLDRDGATIPLQPFEFDEQDLMSVDGNMSALLPFDFNELDLFASELGASPPCSPPAETEPETDTAVELIQTATTVHDPCPGETTQVADACFDMEGVQLDEPVPGEFISSLPCPPLDPAFIAELISASGEVVKPWPAVPAELTWLSPPAEPEPETDTAVELVQTATTVHDPCPGDTTQVADACFDMEGVQLDEPAPGEFISGLPCPPLDPAFIVELISASGEVVKPWPAVPAELTWLCGGDSLSSASLQTSSFGASLRPSVC